MTPLHGFVDAFPTDTGGNRRGRSVACQGYANFGVRGSEGGVDKVLDFGTTTGGGNATHTMTLYRHSSGARVFSTGTVQWSWGLDNNHDRGFYVPSQPIQQATMNLLADMGAQPASVQSGLTASAGSSDVVAPTSHITSPAASARSPPVPMSRSAERRLTAAASWRASKCPSTAACPGTRPTAARPGPTIGS